MKTFEVELGGKRRRLRFTPMDGAKLWRRFNKPLYRLLMDDCLAVGIDGKSTGMFNPDAQLAVIALGLGTDDETASRWLAEAYENGASMPDFIQPAVKAAFVSGILGFSLDLDERQADQGKEQGQTPAP